MPSLTRAIQSLFDHAGAGNTHVDDHIGLAHAKVGACHKGHVLRNVGKNHQFGAAKAATIGGGVGNLENLLTHEGHGVHVDAAARRGHVDGGADAVGFGQSLGQGFNQGAVAVGKALFDQSRKAAQKIDARLLGGFVKGLAHAHHAVGAKGSAHHGNGANADALVHHRDAVLVAHFVADAHELRGVAIDLGLNVGGKQLKVVAYAVKQAHAKGNGTHIKMLVAEHVQRADNFAF